MWSADGWYAVFKFSHLGQPVLDFVVVLILFILLSLFYLKPCSLRKISKEGLQMRYGSDHRGEDGSYLVGVDVPKASLLAPGSIQKESLVLGSSKDTSRV